MRSTRQVIRKRTKEFVLFGALGILLVFVWRRSGQTFTANKTQHGLRQGHWNPGSHEPSSLQEITSLEPDRILSLSFGLAEYKSRIYPFYKSIDRATVLASDNALQEELTVCLVVTTDRLEVLRIWSETYTGPLSVVYAISPTDDLTPLRSLLQSSPDLLQQADIHIAMSDFPRQLNAWRNLARTMARTDLVMMVDADLILRGGPLPKVDLVAESRLFREIEDKTRKIGDENDNVGLVIPAFEWTDVSRGMESPIWVNDRTSVRNLWDSEQIRSFHHSDCQDCYGPTDYETLFKVDDNAPTYRLRDYQLGYEPYLIHRRQGPPMCDENFIGSGRNKQACIAGMILSGMDLHVTKTKFLIHMDHPKSKPRKDEKYLGQLHYERFLVNACLRYLSDEVRRKDLQNGIPDHLRRCEMFEEDLPFDRLMQISQEGT